MWNLLRTSVLLYETKAATAAAPDRTDDDDGTHMHGVLFHVILRCIHIFDNIFSGFQKGADTQHTRGTMLAHTRTHTHTHTTRTRSRPRKIKLRSPPRMSLLPVTLHTSDRRPAWGGPASSNGRYYYYYYYL